MSVDLIFVKNLIVGLASVITACGIISLFAKKYFDKLIEQIRQPILEKLETIDVDATKNYLLEFLNDVKNGDEKSEYQIARAKEMYYHYSEELRGNSYIHEMWDKYMM